MLKFAYGCKNIKKIICHAYRTPFLLIRTIPVMSTQSTIVGNMDDDFVQRTIVLNVSVTPDVFENDLPLSTVTSDLMNGTIRNSDFVEMKFSFVVSIMVLIGVILFCIWRTWVYIRRY